MIEKLQPIIPPWCEAVLSSAATAASIQVKSVRLLGSAYTAEQLRPTRWSEVAVLGRSNVGKSSLVNYLLGSSGLAKVSSQPGHTSSINQYLVNKAWVLADCPGYGYGRVSKTTRADWHGMTQQYLQQWHQSGLLVDVLLLVDASLPPKEADLAGVQWLRSRHLPVTLVYTKCDKSKRGQPAPADNIRSFQAQLDQMNLLQPAQLPTSAVGSHTFGRQEVLQYVARRVAAHAAA